MSWSRRFEIEKKRELDIEELGDGALKIVPGDIKPMQEEVQIPIRKEDTEDKIYYKILREYVKGHNKIILVGSLTDKQMDFIQLVQRRIVGLEVTEQAKDRTIITDLLRPEDVDLDKIVSQMFSFVNAMANDIIMHIEEGKSPGDKILDRDSLTTRNHNLAYRCCSMALRDSSYLSRLRKTTDEILMISRIVRYLDLIGTILVGVSYQINTELTEGMRKYHYRVFEKDEKLNKLLESFLKKWLAYLKMIKTCLKDKNVDRATDLYLRRFEYSFEYKNPTIASGEHLTNITDFCEQLNRMTSLILRDSLMN